MTYETFLMYGTWELYSNKYSSNFAQVILKSSNLWTRGKNKFLTYKIAQLFIKLYKRSHTKFKFKDDIYIPNFWIIMDQYHISLCQQKSNIPILSFLSVKLVRGLYPSRYLSSLCHVGGVTWIWVTW